MWIVENYNAVLDKWIRVGHDQFKTQKEAELEIIYLQTVNGNEEMYRASQA